MTGIKKWFDKLFDGYLVEESMWVLGLKQVKEWT